MVCDDRAQGLERDKATLEDYLREVEHDRAALERRLQRIEELFPATELHVPVTETDTAQVASTPNNATPKARPTEAVPIGLHRLMPGVLFLVEPNGKKLFDCSKFSDAVLSAFHSTLQRMLDDQVDNARLEALREIFRTGSTTTSRIGRRLYLSIRDGNRSGNCSVWTRGHPRFYACKTCVNTQRLCMNTVQDKILVLPLHPLLRTSTSVSEAADEDSTDSSIVDDVDSDVYPTDLGYWVAPKSNWTRAVPCNKLDIWTAPNGGH